ncbi:excisionase family DNA-binding protein [Mycolicibacterium sp. YH-1]|uniref:excisionase family DNA-binding protein n=1 Tax=Mycolicibacterium sp. YH-1 TaxID=2908837 RepID=UPI001F4C4ACE|nr:excisionase family DNA-binding protein [Mycolicibacterium sp. YH-1]UNB52874.1 helix-turn-helix domain-containing protein [Mycolicibacterium sp. YH-1]
MQTLETSQIPADQLEALDNFAKSQAGAELRDVLLHLSQCVRDGAAFAVIDQDAVLTPQEAAERLGMSRSHLYKLLDKGEIVFHRVGRDRRIYARDLLIFEAQRHRDRRELAERFAHQDATRAGAIAEIADLL